MRYSENYHLYLPEGSDFVSPEQFNSNFNAIDTKLKEVETEAKKVSGHTHAAEDLKPGTFVGDYAFDSDGDTTLKITTKGSDMRSAAFQVHRDKSLLDLIAYNTVNQFWKLSLKGYTANMKEVLQLVSNHGETETIYKLFGEHNKPVVSGGYTGTGVGERSISIGGRPTLLIVTDKGSMSALESLAIITNFGDFVDRSALGGIAIYNCGSSPTVSNLQIGMEGSKLQVGSTNSANREFFNISGHTYSYWGLTI